MAETGQRLEETGRTSFLAQRLRLKLWDDWDGRVTEKQTTREENKKKETQPSTETKADGRDDSVGNLSS